MRTGRNGHRDPMTDQLPVPTIDDDPDPGNLAGGPDAVAQKGPFPPVPPDEPLTEQLAEEIPDELQEPEEPDSSTAESDPAQEPTD